MTPASVFVIPAEAGIHWSTCEAAETWIPAFAGTTILMGVA
jgi:hypothetical protein